MKYSGKWYQRAFRYVQVRWFLFTKRYRPVQGGINFYADMRHGGVGVKGYYWRPMSYTTPIFWVDGLPDVEIDFSSFRPELSETRPNQV